jgi:hypothetical protein
LASPQNKVENHGVLFNPKKVPVNCPRLPHNPPQLYRDFTVTNHTKPAKPPAKTPTHRKIFFCQKSIPHNLSGATDEPKDERNLNQRNPQSDR